MQFPDNLLIKFSESVTHAMNHFPFSYLRVFFVFAVSMTCFTKTLRNFKKFLKIKKTLLLKALPNYVRKVFLEIFKSLFPSKWTFKLAEICGTCFFRKRFFEASFWITYHTGTVAFFINMMPLTMPFQAFRTKLCLF